MNFAIPILTIITLLICDIIFYILTFSKKFALRNQDIYDIISIFNDVIFISSCLVAIKLLRKAKFTGSIILLSVPVFYTAILWYFFR